MNTLIILLCLSSIETKELQDDFESDEAMPEVGPPKDIEFPRPVDFLNIKRDGFGDVEFKQPVNYAELDLIKPRNREHAKELLQKAKKNKILWIPKSEILVFNSPRDEFLYHKRLYETVKNATSVGRSFMPDFARNLERNLAHPVVNLGRSSGSRLSPTERNNREYYPRKNISDYFADNSFYLKTDHYQNINWTTCDEFSKRALFHPDDIIDTKWMPFYIWSKRNFSRAFIHTFEYPTKKRVNYYRTNFGPYMKNIDWSQPKLLRKEHRESLLIAGDRKGLFYEIPDQEPPKPEQGKVILPTASIRIKILNPYIALMYCEEFYATIMAELGTEPQETEEKIIAASKLRFNGFGQPVYRDTEEEKGREELKISNEQRRPEDIVE
ncbi:unnamed protein product [Danaus chrysippus]|uniref:(African queen) hypothetical protein n=1 Tax=Danaus chrysippus TaxID=151541 RepID=A0A8J2QBN7_9NEOP|nr:unnamed protein product [Danaus chrysippus]